MRSKLEKFLKSALAFALILVLIGTMLPFSPINNVKAASQVKITYHGQGGKYNGLASYSEYVNIGSPTTIKKNFTYSGYTFLGWSTSSTQSNISFRGGETISFTKNTDLYAVWKKNPSTFTVKYYPDPGNTNVYSTQTVTIGSTVTISSSTSGISKTGYKLTGWSKNKNSTSNFSVGAKVSSSSLSTTANTTVVLYGVWSCQHTSTAVREKQPTCTATGYKETYCTRCGKTISKTTYPINSGNHNWIVAGGGDQTGHLVYCVNCHKTQLYPHNWAVKTDKAGHHWKECVSDGCPHAWKDGTYDECRNYISDWNYYVDRKTYASKGCNLYIREGTCPICGTYVVEYGYATFTETDSHTIVKTIKALVTTAKFIVKYTPAGANNVVTLVCTCHTLWKIISSGVDVIQSIQSTNYETLSAVDLSWINRVEPISRSEGEYTSAQNYFRNQKNMKAAYK